MKVILITIFLFLASVSVSSAKGYEFFCNHTYCSESLPYGNIELIFFDDGTFSLEAGFSFVGNWNKKGTLILLTDCRNVTPNEEFQQGMRFFAKGQTTYAQVCRNGNILINWGLKKRSKLCRSWICFCKKHHTKSFCKYNVLLQACSNHN